MGVRLTQDPYSYSATMVDTVRRKLAFRAAALHAYPISPRGIVAPVSCKVNSEPPQHIAAAVNIADRSRHLLLFFWITKSHDLDITASLNDALLEIRSEKRVLVGCAKG